ncbi:protein-L-isoaspartate O-methyltransferase family protein [Phreatobacter stygius]|uniref:Protein-L-isoaspartate O-methyltransferase n=1 Tax=Phreatobacter stygius TaxID=1940610 RepID=A0A4D7BD73_9HYPH|nr:protein-L-isoaspartate O-methyltransferase [Phreatobacter stygius]QCI68810.1 protein-L-isoaspartate O-methyltransferase [Phreatobacter stygius]
MIDFARARRTMVDTQIRVNDVTDGRIIEALMAVPREAFVPEARRELAYIDDDVAVSEASNGKPARYLIELMVLAKMVHAAAIGPADSVLDIGVTTGYSAAVLARLAAKVVAVEEDETLAAAARQALAASGNVTVVAGALAEGAPQQGPYDVILLEGAVEAVPEALFGQMKEGGRLVAVVGSGRAAKCLVHTRISGEISARPIFDAAIPPLPGFAAARGFVF